MAASPAPKDFQFRRLQKPEEFRAVEEVDRAAGGIPEEPPVPTTVQRVVQDNGGLVVGAFAEIYLAGFAVGFLGWDGEKLYLYSHRTAVRPEYQNHHLGFRLKTHQRDEVLRQGLDEIRWTFDPLQSRTAFLHVHRLGAVPDRYLVHYFGRLGGEGGENLETDRVRTVWKLQDPAVVARLEANGTDRAADERRFAEATPLVETELDEHGLRVPTTVQEPAHPSASLGDPVRPRPHPGACRRRTSGRGAMRPGMRSGPRSTSGTSSTTLPWSRRTTSGGASTSSAGRRPRPKPAPAPSHRRPATAP